MEIKSIRVAVSSIRIFDFDDEVIKQLIETNIRQRGIGNINSVKMMRCERELERIYGIQRGGDRKSNETGFPLKTQAQLAAESGINDYGIRNGGDRKSEETKLPLKSQTDLAEELNMSKVQLRKYKSLTDLIPELLDSITDC